MKAQTADRFLSTAICFRFVWNSEMHFLYLLIATQCIIYCVYILDLTACSTVLLTNSSSDGQEIPPPLPFYETRRFITLLTTVHQLSLSWSRQIQSMSSKICFNTLLIYTCLIKVLQSFRFHHKLCVHVSSPHHDTCPVHFYLLDLPTLITCNKQYKPWSSLCSSSLLLLLPAWVQISSSAPYSQTHTAY